MNLKMIGQTVLSKWFGKNLMKMESWTPMVINGYHFQYNTMTNRVRADPEKQFGSGNRRIPSPRQLRNYRLWYREN